MAGPATPGSEGPSFGPPPLPAGWIAQWDGASRKYYYVQLSTGVSQWDTPTDAAPVGGTPAQNVEHPYGTPAGEPQLITHPDGSQTVRHADGTMEPILPEDATRELDGPTGDRGLGSMATNALLGKLGGGSNHGSAGPSPLGGLASQFLGGLSHSGANNHSSGGLSGSGGLGGKLVGQLASNLFHSGSKPAAPQSYHAGQATQPQSTGGLAGGVMGGVAHMFGGQSHSSSGQNYGYSNSGTSGGYTGSAPPSSYQTPAQQQAAAAPPYHASQPASSGPSYQSPPPGQHGQHATPSYQPPPGPGGHGAGPYGHQSPSHGQHTPSFPPPPTGQGHGGGPYGQSSSAHGQGTPSFPPPPAQHAPQQQYGQAAGYGQQGPIPGPPPGGAPPQYGGGYQPQHQHQHHQQQPPYGGGGGQGYSPQYGHNPGAGAPPGGPQYLPQPSYAQQAPAVPHGSHPYRSNPHY